ncbi:hypothetical protein ACH4OW_20430 [Streptomyces sp. NPDC017056]|uniref:hypothetical protein n=1 Tax=Streptomyces sp. NPDC017056 TaxID=3364973 RepID=UPI0037B1954C
MSSTQSTPRQGPPTPARRTTGDLRRRRGIADAATGLASSGPEVPADDSGVERFRCVIYLCGAPSTDMDGPREECEGYAEMFGWEVVAVVEERQGLLSPTGRPGLLRAVGRIACGEAGALLTPLRTMISPLSREYDEVAREIEKAGGFLHVMDRLGRGWQRQ